MCRKAEGVWGNEKAITAETRRTRRKARKIGMKVFDSCADAISDEELFREGILHESIEGFAGLVEAGDWDGCAGLLAERMRGKAPPSFSSFRGRPRGDVDPARRAEADDILKGVFTLPDSRGGFITETLVCEFEWSPSFEGTQTYYPPKAFRYSLNQHEPLTTLANVYWRTGEEAYRDRIIELLMDWIRRVPTYGELLASGELVRQHWQNMMTRNRFEKWLDFYPLIAPDLSDRDAVDLLKTMVFHADLMNRYVADEMGGRISATLSGMIKVNLKFALLFSEAVMSKHCIAIFKAHFRMGIDSVFYPDGGLKYRCTGYHRAVASWYLQAVELAEELGIEGIDYEVEMARRMEAYTAFLMKPDGSLPLLGDTGSGRDETWREEKLKELAPETPSQRFGWSGLYAMRTGWDEEALYLFFTAGPYGIMHSHQDHLSFEVSGYGKHLIVEPGVTPYGRIEQRKILGASMAHNTLSVDGLGQHRKHVEPDGPSGDPWFTCPAFDFVERRFDEGFGPERSLKVSQVRSILFVKPDYFLVVDRASGEGTHDLAWHFMFYPQSMRIEGNRAVSEEAEGANVSFVWSDPSLEAEMIVGEEDPPYRGMMTGDRPSPSLFLKREADLPFAAAFLIEPLKAGDSARLSLEAMDATDGVAFKVGHEDGREDIILLSEGAASAGGLRSDGVVTAVRLREGRVDAVMAGGANSVTVDGRSVRDLNAPVYWI